MSLVQWIVLLVALQRVGELWLSHRNTARLLAEGGREIGAGHYPLLVAVHVGWLAALFFAVPADAPAHWPLLALFLLLQAARVWVIASLGRYWTTRVIDLPEVPLVRHGPYRWVRHPNYFVVVAEIAILPLAFGAWQIALIFSLLNAAVLARRLQVENTTLRRRAPPRRGSRAAGRAGSLRPNGGNR